MSKKVKAQPNENFLPVLNTPSVSQNKFGNQKGSMKQAEIGKLHGRGVDFMNQTLQSKFSKAQPFKQHSGSIVVGNRNTVVTGKFTQKGHLVSMK